MNLYIENTYWNNFVDFYTSGIPTKISENGHRILFSDENINGYTNINTIVNIHKFIDYIKIVKLEDIEYYCDYKFCRDQIKALFTTWGNHTNEEKMIFCVHHIGNEADRVAFLGSDTLELLNSQYANKATSISRKNRVKFVYPKFWAALPVEAKNLVPSLLNALLQYQSVGLDGTINGDPPSIYDYILGTTGTPYEGVGLIDQDINLIGYIDKQDFCNHLVDMLIYGKYLNHNLAFEMGLL